MIPLRDHNPTLGRPVVTVALIVSCVLVFVWQVTLSGNGGQAAVLALGLTPAVLFGLAHLPPQLAIVPAPATVLTSMFLHGGLLPLGGNMLYLWIFGDNIEDRMGHGRFVVFYVLCGVAAALAQALPDMSSTTPMIGASGAVSGILGAYVLLYPRANVLVALPLFIVFYTFHLPAVFVLGLWFLGQLASSLGQDAAEAGVAFRAHIGGFIAGIVLLRFFLKDSSRRRRIR
jgi:membrane associated rhomboid family serine protease